MGRRLADPRGVDPGASDTDFAPGARRGRGKPEDRGGDARARGPEQVGAEASGYSARQGEGESESQGEEQAEEKAQVRCRHRRKVITPLTASASPASPPSSGASRSPGA